MKKKIAIVLAAVMAMSVGTAFAGCGKKSYRPGDKVTDKATLTSLEKGARASFSGLEVYWELSSGENANSHDQSSATDAEGLEFTRNSGVIDVDGTTESCDYYFGVHNVSESTSNGGQNSHYLSVDSFGTASFLRKDIAYVTMPNGRLREYAGETQLDGNKVGYDENGFLSGKDCLKQAAELAKSGEDCWTISDTEEPQPFEMLSYPAVEVCWKLLRNILLFSDADFVKTEDGYEKTVTLEGENGFVRQLIRLARTLLNHVDAGKATLSQTLALEPLRQFVDALFDGIPAKELYESPYLSAMFGGSLSDSPLPKPSSEKQTVFEYLTVFLRDTAVWWNGQEETRKVGELTVSDIIGSEHGDFSEEDLDGYLDEWEDRFEDWLFGMIYLNQPSDLPDEQTEVRGRTSHCAFTLKFGQEKELLALDGDLTFGRTYHFADDEFETRGIGAAGKGSIVFHRAAHALTNLSGIRYRADYEVNDGTWTCDLETYVKGFYNGDERWEAFRAASPVRKVAVTVDSDNRFTVELFGESGSLCRSEPLDLTKYFEEHDDERYICELTADSGINYGSFEVALFYRDLPCLRYFVLTCAGIQVYDGNFTSEETDVSLTGGPRPVYSVIP